MEALSRSVSLVVDGIGTNEKIHLGYIAVLYIVSIQTVSYINTRVAMLHGFLARRSPPSIHTLALFHPARVGALVPSLTEVRYPTLRLVPGKRSLGSPTPLPPLPWNYVRAWHYSVMIPLIVSSILLDQFVPCNVYLVAFKAAANSYVIGSLDYVLSQTRKAAAWTCAVGSLLWLCSFFCQMWLLRNVFGGDEAMVRQTSYTPWAFALEWLRTGHYLSFAGIFTDLIFSPMHRLTHHPSIYNKLHKGHHQTTTQLSGLELWRGHPADDLIMAFTIVVGNFATMMICTRMGLGYTFNPLSNTAWYIYQVYLPYSHASDARLANLIAPMPEALNFAAYHHVHHEDSSKNYGLTLPSDLFWDKLLGVSTIMMPSEFNKRKAGKVK